jgi:hypothetical protein
LFCPETLGATTAIKRIKPIAQAHLIPTFSRFIGFLPLSLKFGDPDRLHRLHPNSKLVKVQYSQISNAE